MLGKQAAQDPKPFSILKRRTKHGKAGSMVTTGGVYGTTAARRAMLCAEPQSLTHRHVIHRYMQARAFSHKYISTLNLGVHHNFQIDERLFESFIT